MFLLLVMTPNQENLSLSTKTKSTVTEFPVHLKKVMMTFYVKISESNTLYPITPLKGTAPLSGSIKDFAIFRKTKSSKKGACALFLALIFRSKSDIFLNKKKLHIDLKKKKEDKN